MKSIFTKNFLLILLILFLNQAYAQECCLPYTIRLHCVTSDLQRIKLQDSKKASVKITAYFSPCKNSYFVENHLFDELADRCHKMLSSKNQTFSSLLGSNARQFEFISYLYPVRPKAENHEIDCSKQASFAHSQQNEKKKRCLKDSSVNADNESGWQSSTDEDFLPADFSLSTLEASTDSLSENDSSINTCTPTLLADFKYEIFAENQFKLSQQLFSNGFIPSKIIEKDGKVFYLCSKIIKRPGYFQSVFYTKMPNGRYYPRFIYLSNSSGTWRSAPVVASFPHRYSKGLGYHYTQETVLFDELVDAMFESLNEKSNIEHLNEDPPEKLWLSHMFTDYIIDEEIITFARESNIYDDLSQLRFLKSDRLSPGAIGKFNFTASFDFKMFVNHGLAKTSGFIPNFNAKPIKTFTTSHTLLSQKIGTSYFIKDIIVRVYKAQLNGRAIHWYMHQDRKNRVWIEKIVFAHNPLTSYGTPAEVINSGPLTNKPLEHLAQTYSLTPKSEYLPFAASKHYVDITPLLDQLLPIQLFRQALGLQRRLGEN